MVKYFLNKFATAALIGLAFGLGALITRHLAGDLLGLAHGLVRLVLHVTHESPHSQRYVA